MRHNVLTRSLRDILSHGVARGRVTAEGFRLSLEDASDSIVPVRFEVQPRSFLRLTFEAVPG